MPKMKTNRQAKKKFRLNAAGKAKHAQAFTSHNTGKRSSKRNRRLRKTVPVNDRDMVHVRRTMPYGSKGH